MPDNKRISELTTAPTLNGTDMFEISQESAGTTSGYATFKTNLTAMANKVATGTQYAGLSTTAKDLVGAINEAAESGGSDVEVTPILTEGTKIATITVDDTPADIYGENTKEEIRKMKTPKTVTGNPVTFETIEETFAKGAELTFGPIQSGTGDPSPTNIRPISGRDSVDVVVTGKNLLPNAMVSCTTDGIAYTVNNDGTINVNGTATAETSKTARFSLKAGSYIYSSSVIESFQTYDSYLIVNSKTIARGIEGLGAFTLSEDSDVMLAIRVRNGQTVNIVFKPMIRLATVTDSSFVPYTAQTKTITFPSTIYGGTDEVVGGVGQSNMGMVDLGTLNWSYSTSRYFTSSAVSGIKIPATQDDMINAICSNYKQDTARRVYTGDSGDGCFAVRFGTGVLWVRDSDYTDAETFKTAMSGVQLCYELATPTAFSTEPTPILLNAGTNVVSTDADTAAITYTEMATLDDMRTLINAAQTT